MAKKKKYGYGYSKPGYGYSKPGYGYGKAGNVKKHNTPHKNPFDPIWCLKGFFKNEEVKQVLKNVREHNGIIYGSTSAGMHKGIHPLLKKPITDVDVLVKNPKSFAFETERELDNMVNFDCYAVQEMQTDSGVVFRVINKCRGNEVVCDVSPMRKKPKTVIIKGMRVESLKSREHEIRRMLKDPKAVYRREKDLHNLGWVIKYKQQIKQHKREQRPMPQKVNPFIFTEDGKYLVRS